VAAVADPLALIVGLGNPGPRYAATRHNAGADFVTQVAQSAPSSLQTEVRFHGIYGRIDLVEASIRLLIPTTYMNRSGQAVSSVAKYFAIQPGQILVAHDELDLAPGTARLKTGGGHGGHNGLRDIIKALGTADFHRLRIGIGHPGDARDVVDYVLQTPSKTDREAISAAIDESIATLPLVLRGDMARAMTRLHSFRAN